MWKNRKYDKALLILIKRYPDKISMCPYCSHINYDKSKIGGLLDESPYPERFHCKHCGGSIYGTRVDTWDTLFKMHLKYFIKETPPELFTLENLIVYMHKTYFSFWPGRTDCELLGEPCPNVDYYKEITEKQTESTQ